MTSGPVILEREGIDRLIETLAERGHRVVGPTLRNGAVVLGDLASTRDLPVGIGTRLEPGRYRVVPRDDSSLFGFVVGPSSGKGFFHPSGVTVWAGERADNGSFTARAPEEQPRYAFVGLRPCDAAAIAIQDKVFTNGNRDRVYAGRRERGFVVVVNCTEPGGTCFCASMATGPRVTADHDLALTEVPADDGFWYLAEPGSDQGAEVLGELDGRAATAGEQEYVDRLLSEAAGRMGRALDVDELPARLTASLDNPRWEEIASRCLTCGNCTLVCPTCFCATVEDQTDLAGVAARRVRRWDSCFNQDFSYIHGGPLRPSPYARYRQWLTHKLATWVEQFGEMGCVGCGRCITWCPVGIDITVEAAAFAATTREEARV